MIGERIAFLRKRKKLTQAELAKFLYVSPKTVSKWENGYGLPDVKILPDLAKALGVDCDYLLTGRGQTESGTPVPTEEKKPCVRAVDKDAYRLGLYQVTHNHLTKGILFLNVAVLVLAIICGPADLKNKDGSGFGTFTILTAIYSSISDSVFQNAWTLVIGVVWMAVLLLIAVSSVFMLVATMNGRNEHYVKLSAVEFCCVFLLAVVTCVGSWITNLYAGEVMMRLNAFFILLLFCTFLQLILNILVSRHGKRLHGLKQIAAVCLAALVALSVVGAVLPQKAVATELDEASVCFSELDLSVTEREVHGVGGDWLEYRGEGIITLRANIKIKALYDCLMSYSQDNYTQILFFNYEYLQTQYEKGNYYGFFRISFTASTNSLQPVSDFSFSCAVKKYGEKYTLVTKTHSPAGSACVLAV